jgi:hypothetical protein
MLDSAAPVLQEFYRRFPKGGATLEEISKIVIGVTRIDRTYYQGFDTPRTNPIWGSFKRFEQSDAVYGGNVTIVEVRYAQHLTEDERVFVVCKELCHSLEDAEGTHVVTPSAVDDLVASFSLFSSSKAAPGDVLTAFHFELLATIIAGEMVCPLGHRRNIVATIGDDPDWHALGSEIKIPLPYRRALCSKSQMDAVERMLKAFKVIL